MVVADLFVEYFWYIIGLSLTVNWIKLAILVVAELL